MSVAASSVVAMDHFSGASTTHPVVGCAEEIASALKSVAGVDPAFMRVDDKRTALVSLAAARDQLEALWLRVVDASDDVAAVEGARDIAAWLFPATRQDRSACAAAQRLAHGLATRWVQLGAAVNAGEVNIAQARVITRALDDLATAGQQTSEGIDDSVLTRAETALVRLARRHTPAELRRLGDRILSVVAPQLAEEHERRQLEAAEARAAATTRLSLQRRGDGSTDLRARIPDQVASRLKTYLDAYTSPRVEGGTKGAGVVDPATGERLSYDKLLGGAFCSLLESIDPKQMPLHAGSPTTVVTTLTLAQLRDALGAAETGDGTRMSAAQARRLACNAGIIPAVLGRKSQVLDLGRRSRLFTGGQKLAMALEHPTCRAQGCTVPATWCEAHHAKDPWSKGGRTDLADGVLLCSWHHHRAHDATYQLRRMPNGDIRFHRRT